jgi:GGDEF domain-containing protein
MEDRPQNKPEGDTAQDFSIEKIEGLRDLLQDEIIGLESGDLRTKNKEEHDQAKQKLDKEKKKRPHSFYRDLIFSLTGLRLDERWARADWEEILKHKYQMSERLGRNVGLRVAALDFYMNIKKRLNRAVVVAVDTLTDALEQSITDSLTGAYNRGYFDGAMKRYFQRARVTQKIFSMLLLDVDYFKN